MSPGNPLPGPPRAAFVPPTTLAVPTDGKAIASLAFALSAFVTCLGPVAGIPAIVLGIVSLRDIRGSDRALGGRSYAVAGILLGSLSVVAPIVFVALVGVAGWSRSFTPTVTPYAVPTANVELAAHEWIGAIEVVHLEGGNLQQAWLEEKRRANISGKTLLAQTSGNELCPRSCPEVRHALRGTALQEVLARVVLVEVDVDTFGSELTRMGVPTNLGPMFFILEESGAVRDLISADEWDENDDENMAPVLKSFLGGAYAHRRISDPRRSLRGPKLNVPPRTQPSDEDESAEDPSSPPQRPPRKRLKL